MEYSTRKFLQRKSFCNVIFWSSVFLKCLSIFQFKDWNYRLLFRWSLARFYRLLPSSWASFISSTLVNHFIDDFMVELNVNQVLGFYVTNVYRRTFILYLAGTAPFISSFALSSMYMPRISFLSHLLSFLWVSLDLLLDDLIGKRNLQLFFNCPLRHNLPPSAHCWRQTVNCTKNEPNLVTHHIPNTALLLCISMPPQITDGNAKD